MTGIDPLLTLAMGGHMSFLKSMSDILGSSTNTQAFLQGPLICYSDFTADLRFRIRKVCRHIADINPPESDNKLVTYHSWFACPTHRSPVLDL